jgi:hypothetical protein
VNFYAGDLENRQGCVDRKFGADNYARDPLTASPKAGYFAHSHQFPPIPTILPYHHGREKKLSGLSKHIRFHTPCVISSHQTSKASPPSSSILERKSTAIKARWVTLTESERALELVYPPRDDVKPFVINEFAVCLQQELSPEGHDRPEHLLEGVSVSRAEREKKKV